MTDDEFAEFLKLLKSMGWNVVSRKEGRPLMLGEEVTTRYPDIPGDYLDFLERVSVCVNADRNVSFLCESDYNGSTSSSWKEFELMDLEAGREFGSEEIQRIETFWREHFPFMISYKGDYGYLAIRLSKDDYGAIVAGYTPDIEGILRVTDSFAEFIELFSSILKNESDDLVLPDFI